MDMLRKIRIIRLIKTGITEQLVRETTTGLRNWDRLIVDMVT